MRRLRLAALLALLPGSAAACAVCFGGQSEAQGLVDGIWWGIVLLIAVTFTMVGGIAWFFWKVEKNKLAQEGARG
ncbi:MAG: hypothetical protein M0D55_09290 [Elusimicrobiota bacterium]|nr:MAG: hypothetical protein M0D55_09290 [Elusimicrobiota bacterium]